jgi:hypothetical protein
MRDHKPRVLAQKILLPEMRRAGAAGHRRSSFAFAAAPASQAFAMWKVYAFTAPTAFAILNKVEIA